MDMMKTVMLSSVSRDPPIEIDADFSAQRARTPFPGAARF
jgi:hypothetical protein